MGATIGQKARTLIALILAFVCAFSISGFSTASAAFADDVREDREVQTTVSGVDFLQPNAQGWELLKVDNLGDQAIYVTIKKDGKPLSNPVKFTAAENSTGEHTGTGDQIAQIVAAQMLADQGATQSQTPNQLLGNAHDHASYTLSVSTALMQGDELYRATIYPIYANVVDSDGSSELVLLGVRTANDIEKERAKNIGVAQTYYKQSPGEDTHPVSYSLQTKQGIDNMFDSALGAYVVTYQQNDQSAIEGTVNYVDAETGKTVMAETFTGIGANDKLVSIKKSFTALDPDNSDKTRYYRAISSLAGTKVPLNLANASYTVRVIPVNGMDENSYSVSIEYVNENDELLWSDSVDVKGYGYRYTLPNTFSMNKQSQIDSADGVNFYRLDEVVGGKVVSDTAREANDGNGTAINLTTDLVDADFVLDENGQRTVKALYRSQDVTKELDFTLVEIDGETGKQLDRITATITPDADFTYLPERKVIDGKTYVPWAGNTDRIDYSWESLGQSVDLLQYVYYVPEDYVPGAGYDITVQYRNIANGAILRTQTIPVDPEMTNYVEVVGEERFTQDGNEYVRLAGQDSGIRHAFFSPDRTYTIYYRDVDDVISPNTVAVRTQIIETTVAGTGGGLSAAPTLVDAAAGDPDVEAGVAPGDGTVIINDDDNPLANPNGDDTATERTIEDNENPLASGSSASNEFITTAAIVGVLALLAALAYALIRRRRNTTDATDKTRE